MTSGGPGRPKPHQCFGRTKQEKRCKRMIQPGELYCASHRGQASIVDRVVVPPVSQRAASGLFGLSQEDKDYLVRSALLGAQEMMRRD